MSDDSLDHIAEQAVRLHQVSQERADTIVALRAEITRLRAQVASLTAAVEGERERCARVAEDYPTNDYAIGMAVRGIAAAIREGG